jgi:rhamnosyltransferase
LNKIHSTAGVIVLFNPDKNVIENINSYIDYIDILVAVDNSEILNENFMNFLSSNPKICYIQNNTNQGIAKALNQGAKFAVKNCYSWLLTMDQDSRFEDDNAAYFFNCFDKLENLNETAIISCLYYSPEVNSIKITDNIYDFEMPLITITSGNLLNLKLYEQIGKFEEKLFIDQVDHDYCFRAWIKNYKIIRFKNLSIKHSLGKQIFVNGKLLFIHPPIRLYYQTRNFLYLLSKYFFLFPLFFIVYGYQEIKRMFFINLYFDKINRKVKICKILEGFKDFSFNNYGKYESNQL